MNTSRQSQQEQNRYLLAIILVLLVGCISVVTRYGVRWEESIEHAQILTKSVEYPEGHPLRLYVDAAPSGQTYLSAAILTTTDSPRFLALFRSCLYIVASILPVAMLVWALGGARGVMCAVAFILLGAVLEFDSTYPMSLWPGAFTNGHIGTGYMLLTLAAITAQRWKVGAFLVGAAGAIHVGQVPPLFLAAGFAVLYLASQREFQTLRSMVLPFAVGMAITACTFVVARVLAESAPISGIYFSDSAANEIWRSYTFHHDTHRFFPPLNALVGAGLTLLVTVTCAHAMRRNKSDVAWPFLIAFIYTAAITTTVTVAFAVHTLMGENTPFLVIGWMPYRLLNQLPFIAIAVAVTFPAARWSGTVWRWYQWFPCALLISIALLGRSGFIIPSDFVAQYLRHGEFIFFVLCGTSLGLFCHAVDDTKPMRFLRLFIGAITILVIAPVHQWGTACVGFGILLGLVVGLTRTSRDQNIVSANGGAIVAITIAMLGILIPFLRPPMPQPNFAVGEFEGAVKDYLAEVDPKAMVAAGPNAFLFQAQTGHPVFVDTTTLSLISYMPDLGPVINKMYDEVYDMPITSGPRDPDRWLTVWAERSRDEWTALTPWGFTYVAAPDNIQLDLESVLHAGNRRLYRMP